VSIADIIVGRVGAAILRQRIATAKQADGASDAPALFRLDRLSSGHIAAIVREIHSDAAGRIARFLVGNSELVDAGQDIIALESD